ncbi:MAG: OmpA family protein [Gallionellaceae bacterium]
MAAWPVHANGRPDGIVFNTIWLRQIAKLFANADSCFDIVGHSSRSGDETFNELLSLQRAQYIQKLMQKDSPNIMERSKAIGRGWKENIVGIGSDDMRDAIDRRVEFRITPCR